MVSFVTVNVYSNELSKDISCSVEEIDGRNNTATINQSKRTENERNIRNQRCISYFETLYNIFSYSDIMVERCILLPECHNLSILTYIHNKDGKK